MRDIKRPPTSQESDLLDIFDNTPQSSEVMKRAVLAALVSVLILIWAPINLEANVIDVQQAEPVKRPPRVTFVAKAVEVVRAETNTLRTRIPMPAENPDVELPVVVPKDDIIATPDMLETGDWDDNFLPEAPEFPESSLYEANMKGLQAPVFTQRVQPVYPTWGIKTKTQGYVLLEAVLRSDGSIDNIKVLRGLARGKFGFEDEAMKALKRWQFEPGKLKDKPVDVRMTLKIDFTLSR